MNCTKLGWQFFNFIISARTLHYFYSFNDYSVWERPLLRVSKVVFDTGCNSLCHWEKGFFPIGCMKGWEREQEIYRRRSRIKSAMRGASPRWGGSPGRGKHKQWGIGQMLTMRGIKPYGYHEPGSWVSMAGPVSLNSRANAPQLQEAKALVKDLLYCHNGSFSQPRGNPMAFMSMEG